MVVLSVLIGLVGAWFLIRTPAFRAEHPKASRGRQLLCVLAGLGTGLFCFVLLR
jgi:hypothetical protein